MHSHDSGSSAGGPATGPLPAGIPADRITDGGRTSPDMSPPGQPAPAQEAVGLLPLVDAAVLEELEEELAGTGMAQRFARDYAAMWDERYSRLAAAVHRHDGDSALDAAISLKISSAMVGGLRLAKLAELLETMIRSGDFGRGKVLMERVAQDGSLTVTELRSTYILETG
ncbi:Hpt domain-containing protein [Pseudarthrobacter equi]|uniref:Hpt domain-containing protein n=1 Tax=Pseudarthrobacter equi TaxID=728066 RepID=UPI0028D761AD|nr:Hpt domain-containing protein [Pseudarthrobacter equi]